MRTNLLLASGDVLLDSEVLQLLESFRLSSVTCQFSSQPSHLRTDSSTHISIGSEEEGTNLRLERTLM